MSAIEVQAHCGLSPAEVLALIKSFPIFREAQFQIEGTNVLNHTNKHVRDDLWRPTVGHHQRSDHRLTARKSPL